MVFVIDWKDQGDDNMEYKSFRLKDSPFRLTPPLNPEEIIWVGMNKLKLQLENRMEMSMKTSMSRLIINWGNYGSGKGHAASYYSRTNRLRDLSEKISVSPAKSFKVNLPRTSKDIVQALLRSLLDQIKFDSIISDFQQIKRIFRDDFEKIVRANSHDNVIEQFFIMLTDESNQKKMDTIKNFLYGDTTKSTLQQLNLPLGIADDEQVVNLISTIFNCITYEKKLYSTIFLWIDDCEDIDTLTKSIADRFVIFLRQLIEKTPNHLTIFLNFTPKRFMNLGDLSIYFGEALSSRARLQIPFTEPSIDEAIDYLKELLNHPHFRNEQDVDKENSLFPFSEDVAKYVLNNIGRLSIRKINGAFSIILELALIQEVETLSIDFVESIKEEIISWEGEK